MPGKKPAAPRSLPELAAAMIQLGADERPELLAIRKELAQVLATRKSDQSGPEEIAELLEQALVQLDALLAGTPRIQRDS